MHPAKNGAFTGEISAEMLIEAGCTYVLLGHSERRAMGEIDEFIHQKVKSAHEAGLKVILCVDGQSKEELQKQLFNISESGDKLVIAYEPVWAIGTGQVAGREHIEEIHTLIKSIIDIPVLYGGSVNEKNAREILAMKNVDGILVGGASLDPEKFMQIIF